MNDPEIRELARAAGDGDLPAARELVQRLVRLSPDGGTPTFLICESEEGGADFREIECGMIEGFLTRRGGGHYPEELVRWIQEWADHASPGDVIHWPCGAIIAINRGQGHVKTLLGGFWSGPAVR